jgi:3-oxoadipate enol-lactonase
VQADATVDTPYPTTVRDTGDGPPIVLLHGTPLDLHAWDGLTELLAPRRRVIAYDLRGHGSALDTPLPDSFDPLVGDLLAVLDALGIDHAHVVGHSFGGQVALSFAATHPDRITALSVICARTSPHPPFAAAADAIEANGIASVVDGALARWFTPAQLERDEPAVQYVRAHLTVEVEPTLVRAFRLIAAFDLGDRLAELHVPSWFVAAERDEVATPDDLEAAADRIPWSHFVFEPDAGHLLPLQRPDRIATLIH